MKNLILFTTVATLFAGAVSPVFAGSGGYGSSNCQVVYGGGEVCPPSTSYDINKQVQTPGKGGEFVENLTINDHKFTVGEAVTYKITVKNTGKDAVRDLTITDTLPTELDFTSSSGKFNADNRTVTFTVDSLATNKTAEFYISTKVRAVDNTQCPINTVSAIDSSHNTAQDTAMICTETSQKGGGPIVQQTPPMKQTPSTGPEMLSLVALIPSGALGLFLNRKSRRA